MTDKLEPTDYIEFIMEQMNLKQSDLVKAGCGTKGHVSEMVRGKRRLTVNFIRKFMILSHREKMAYLLIGGLN